MSRRTAFRLLTACILLLAAAAGWGVWWLHLAGQVRQGIDRWAEARRAEGWRVSFDTVAIDGFPGTMRIRLGAVRLTRPDGLDWQAPPVSGALWPLDPQRVRVEAPGRHEIAARGATGEALALRLDLGEAGADLAVDGAGRLAGAEALLARVSAAVPGGASATAERIEARLRRQDAPADADHATTTATFGLSTTGLDLPAGAVPVMERRVAAASVSGRLQGAIPAGALAPALDRWREDGGTVEIDRLEVDWQPLRVSAEGTLALDAAMQPMLAMTASIQGFFGLVDALVRHGAVRPKDAQVARLVLGLMAKAPPEGGAPTLQVPVTVQERTLSVGPAVLGRVPPIPWPEAVSPPPGSPPPAPASSPRSAPR